MPCKNFSTPSVHIWQFKSWASVMYASPAWCMGIHHRSTANDRDRIDRMINRLKRGSYLPPGNPSFVELAEKADKRLFNAMTANPTHVLSKYLPNLKSAGHNLRPIIGGIGLSFHAEKDNLNFRP